MSGLLTWWLPLAATAIGAVLFLAGRVGRRVGEHPHCRRCGRDLFGLDGVPQRCPECGRMLSQGRIRMGERRRRPKLMAAGALLLAPGLLWVSGISALALAGSNLDRHKPVWLLAWETEGSRADGALAELKRRLRGGELTVEETDALVERFLDHQAELDRPWHGEKGTFIDYCQQSRLLKSQQWERYVHNGVAPAVRTRPVITAGAELPIEVDVSKLRLMSPAAIQSGVPMAVGVVPLQLSLAREDDPSNPLGAVSVVLRPWAPDRIHERVKVPADAAGPRGEVEAVLIAYPNASRFPQFAPATTLLQAAEQAATASRDSEQIETALKVRVVAAREQSVHVDDSTPTIEAVKEAISGIAIHAEFPSWWKLVLIGEREQAYDPPKTPAMIRVSWPPSIQLPGAAYKVLLDDGRSQEEFGTLYWRAGDTVGTARGMLPAHYAIEPPTRVRILLRADPAAAERTLDLVEICGGDFELEDVPVTYPDWFEPHRERLAATGGG